MPSHKLIQFTDPHIVATPAETLNGMDSAISLQQVMAHANNNHVADAFIITGDLIHDDSLEAYLRLAALIDVGNLPVHVLPGNHDVPALMHQAYAAGGISVSGSFHLGSWQIILLDSSVAGSSIGNLSKAELIRLEHLLSLHAHAPTLVCVHHHPVTIDSAWMDSMKIQNADALLKCLARHNQVKALVFGHVHQEVDMVINGIRCLGTPSTCVQFLPGSDEFALDTRSPGYRCLYLHDSGQLETKVVRVPVTT